MDLTFTEEEEAFRQEVRAWIPSAMPDAMREKARGAGGFTPEDSATWHRVLYEKGWIAPHWPEELGGTGWDAARRFLFAEAVELGEAAGRRSGEYSGGMQRRLNIALALIHDPEIVILDEPEAGLDPQS